MDSLLVWALSFWNRLKALARRSRLDADIEDELRFHLEMRAEAGLRQGLPPLEAHAEAQRQFGPTRRIGDACRDLRQFLALEALLQDARFGVRTLLRSPGLTFAALLILATGIGVNTTLFTLASALLTHPIGGIQAPAQLGQIGRNERGEGFDTLSYREFDAVRQLSVAFRSVAARHPVELSLRGASSTERVDAEAVSNNFFSTLGVEMAAGTGFSSDDQRIIISHRLWQQLFQSDPQIVGREVVVNRQPVAIAGVTAPDFRGIQAGQTTDAWIPLSLHAALFPGEDLRHNPTASWLHVIARKQDGVPESQATLQVNAMGSALRAEHPELGERGLAFEPGVGWSPQARRQAMTAMAILFAVTVTVLIVACCNVANLLLARATSRSREMAMRIALGSGRPRIVRQVIVEAGLLAAIAGALSLGLAYGCAELLRALAPAGIVVDATIDARVAALCFVLSLAAGVAAGLPPALQESRPAPAGISRSPLRSIFVVAQLALSVMLTIASGLLVRTLQQSQHVELGFTPQGLIAAYYDLEPNGYDEARGREFHRQALERIRTIPGVESAALGRSIPLQGNSLAMPLTIAGQPDDPAKPNLVRVNVVSAGYFATLRTALRSGREFESSDRAASPPVAIVNETAARRLFTGEDPKGKRVRMFREQAERQIIGVVADSKYANPIEDVRPTVYLPLEQQYWSRAAIHVRTQNPEATARAIRTAMRGLDADLPLFGLVDLERQFQDALGQRRWIAALVSSCGAIALLLAVLGLYGILSYAVAQRTRELAIRLALGAPPGVLMRSVLASGIRLAGAGCAVGIGLSLAGARAIQSQLYGVPAADPITFASAILLLLAVAALACAAPAWRATRVDPLEALRSE